MIKQFQVGGFDDNFSYLIVDEGQGTCAVVDPCGDLHEVFSFIENESLEVIAILITHSHHDHIEGIPEVLERHDVPVYIHKKARGKVEGNYIDEGDEIFIGDIIVKVLYTPGHIDDAVCFYIEPGENTKETNSIPSLITGDTLFVEGCGRAAEADASDLFQSLQRLKKLPPETKVYTGHDYGSIPISTIAHERANNRFLLAQDYNTFHQQRFSQ